VQGNSGLPTFIFKPGKSPAYDGYPLQTSPRHGGLEVIFKNYLLPIRRRGVPSGAATLIVPDEE